MIDRYSGHAAHTKVLPGQCDSSHLALFRGVYPRGDVDPDALQAALELITIGAVAITTRALGQAAGGIELTFPQWRSLVIVGESNAGARVSEVAGRVGVTLPATSRLLQRLAGRGLVALERDSADHRATRATLTAKGARVRADILAFRRRYLREIADGLGASDQPEVEAIVERLAVAFGQYA